MRLFLFLFFITSLFASCNKSSNSKAYESYIDAKQDYIRAILDDNKKNEINSLENIISCGNFLGININKYQKELNKLKPKKLKHKVQIKSIIHKKPLKKKEKLKLKPPFNLEPQYIKIVTFYPLKIKLNSKMKVKYSTLINKNRYYKIFDISNAKISNKIDKKISQHIYAIIAQNSKNRVRVVLYARNKFKVGYSMKHNYLRINLLDKPISKYQKVPIIKKQFSFKQKVIVIDPGHGGKDPGGIGFSKIKEKDVVLKIGRYLRFFLKKRGYKVYMTRDKDYFVTLPNRTKFANRHHANLFISLHCNIIRGNSKVNGPTTYFLSPARTARANRVAKYENRTIGSLHTTNQKIVLNFLNKDRIIQSDKMAMDIQRNIIYNLRKNYKDIYDRGVRPAPFWVLVGTQMPAILIETGFLTNKKEALRLNNAIYQKRLAKGIADGIASYFAKNR